MSSRAGVPLVLALFAFPACAAARKGAWQPTPIPFDDAVPALPVQAFIPCYERHPELPGKDAVATLLFATDARGTVSKVVDVRTDPKLRPCLERAVMGWSVPQVRGAIVMVRLGRRGDGRPQLRGPAGGWSGNCPAWEALQVCSAVGPATAVLTTRILIGPDGSPRAARVVASSAPLEATFHRCMAAKQMACRPRTPGLGMFVVVDSTIQFHFDRR